MWTWSLNINACDIELNGVKHVENWTLDWLKRIDKEKNCHMSNALNTVVASRAQIILGVKYCTQTFELPLLNFCTLGVLSCRACVVKKWPKHWLSSRWTAAINQFRPSRVILKLFHFLRNHLLQNYFISYKKKIKRSLFLGSLFLLLSRYFVILQTNRIFRISLQI